jgi:RHS repeat-associated protein
MAILKTSDPLDYGARYYDPCLNRFISPDTIIPDTANPQDWNRYAYVSNNPLKHVDPTGHTYYGKPMIDGFYTPQSRSKSTGGATKRDVSVWQKQQAADVTPAPRPTYYAQAGKYPIAHV